MSRKVNWKNMEKSIKSQQRKNKKTCKQLEII